MVSRHPAANPGTPKSSCWRMGTPASRKRRAGASHAPPTPSMRAHSRSCRSSIRDDRFMFHRFSAWSSRANVPRAFAWSIDGTIDALSSATVFPAKSEKYEQRTAAEPVFGTDRIAPRCHRSIHCAPRHHIKRSKGCGGAFTTVICLISG